MARKPRSFARNVPLHLVQRGHNRHSIFDKKADFLYYLTNLAELKSELDVSVYGYCLMTNHVHLIVNPQSDPAAVSRLVKVIAARQTRYRNRLSGRSGTMWEGRYKASIIETDRYLLTCLRYVDLNPVRASMVQKPGDYEWSSFKHHAGASQVNWLDDAPSYVALGTSREKRAQAFRLLAQQAVPETDLELIRQALARNQVTGSPSFRSKFGAMLGVELVDRGPGRPPKNKSDPI